MRRVLAIAAVVLLGSAVAACGGRSADPDPSPSPTVVAERPCQLTLAQARRRARAVVRTQRTPGVAVAVVHQGSHTTSYPSPQAGRNAAVIVNTGEETIAFRLRSGTAVERIFAAPGCGAAGSIPHRGRFVVDLTFDGRPSGSYRPVL